MKASPSTDRLHAKSDSSVPSFVFAAAIILVTIVAYVPALRAGYVWDDDAHVTKNPALGNLDGLRSIWLEPYALPQYYPLVHTTFWIERRLWGLDPLGYHTVNVLLHASGAALLGLILRRLGVPGAWLAAAIFAVHPVHVESVAWITERKNVLSGVFYFLSLLLFARFFDLSSAGDGGASGRGRARDGAISSPPSAWGLYALGTALYLCALLSKTVTSTMPVAILLLIWWKRGRVAGREAVLLAPLFVTGAALGMTTAWLEKHDVGAQGHEWALSFLDRCLLAGRALWFYAGKLAWPFRLTFVYPRWRIDAGVWWQYLFPLATVGVLAVLWILRRRVGSGPLVSVLFFVLTLAPALGFINVYPMRFSFVADHFQYLASAGLIALFAGAAMTGIEKTRLGRPAALAGGAALVALLGAGTWRQAHVYKDSKTLWSDTLRKNPSAWIAHNNLAQALEDEGRRDEAAAHYVEALRLKPDYAEAHNNLGFYLAGQGKRDEALVHYLEALRLNPSRAETENNIGLLLAQQGRTGEALEHLTAALRINPRYAEAHTNLGNVFASQGRAGEAVAQYQEALAIDPGFVAAHNNFGILLFRQGKIGEAIDHYEQAVRLKPDHAQAHRNLAYALEKEGRLDEAIAHYLEALRLKPDFAEAHYDLGNALFKQEKIAEALVHYARAIELRPDYPEAHNNMAMALVRQGRAGEAREHHAEALRLKSQPK